MRGSEIQLSNHLNAYVNADGLLNTRKLPRSMINDVRGLLKENLIKELMNNDELITGILDTGSSLICTSHKSDFKEETLKPLKESKKMGGIAGNLEITHSGITNYQTIDTNGRIVQLEREGYLIPGLPVRLLPPQKLVRDENDEWYKINDKKAEL